MTTYSVKRNSKGQFVKGQGFWTNKKRGTLTEEWKENISKANKGKVGRKPTKEERKERSERMLGKPRAGNPENWKHTEKTKKKIGESGRGRKGDLNSNWKGGITGINPAIRYSSKGIEWRKQILKRDDYTCQECGKRGGGELNVDHIIPLYVLITDNKISTLEEAYECAIIWDLDNGRVLCRPCHKNTATFGRKAYTYNSVIRQDDYL